MKTSIVVLAGLVLASWLDPALGQAQAPLFKNNGSFSGSLAGFSVAMVGDLDSPPDGKAEYMAGEPGDWLVGTPSTYLQGNFIVFDGATGTTKFTDYGSFTSPGDRLGSSVSRLTDITGDGIPEFCAGAIQGNYYPVGSSTLTFAGNGYVRVYDGASGALLRQISGVFSAPTGNGTSFGNSLADVGDVDGDGYADLAVGAPFDACNGACNLGSGMVWVFSGSDIVNAAPGNISPLYTIISPGYAGGFEDWFGFSIDGIGDLDGDGYGDILVGAPASSSQQGNVYVYSGQLNSSGPQTLLYPVFSSMPTNTELYGWSVRRAGDVDLDGVEDYIVGAPQASQLFGNISGRAEVVSGATFSPIMSVTPPTMYSGLTAGCGLDLFGFSVAGVGDLDGDGYPDLLVGCPGNCFITPDSNAQTTYSPGCYLPPSAWSGYNGSITGSATLFSGRTSNVLKDMNGAFTGSVYGVAVAGGQDVNGDGFPDYVVGATANAVASVGYTEVESGAYELGQVYGCANPNTTGFVGSLRATGSYSITENNLKLVVTGLPSGTTGQFFFGTNMLSTPTTVSAGNRWIGNPVTRFGSVTAIGTTATLTLNLAASPFAGVITPGTEFAFQFEYRNAAAGAGVTNLSDALNIGFYP